MQSSTIALLSSLLPPIQCDPFPKRIAWAFIRAFMVLYLNVKLRNVKGKEPCKLNIHNSSCFHHHGRVMYTPHTPLLFSKTGICRGIHFLFLL